MSSSTDNKLRLAEVVAALSLATDMGTGQPLERGLRTCLLAFRLGQLLGLDEKQLHTVYYVALLRFVGCTADAVHLKDIFGDELVAQAQVATVELLPLPMLAAIIRHAGAEFPLSRRLQHIAYGFAKGVERTREAEVAHCEVSRNIAQRLGLGTEVDIGLRQIFERWDGRGPGELRGDDLCVAIRLVHVAQDAEVFHRVNGDQTMLAVLHTRTGGSYDPLIVQHFVQHYGELLAEIEHESVWEIVLDLEPEPRPYMTDEQLDTAARAIADFSDLRSPYTRTHSPAVAELAFTAAVNCGLTADEARTVRLAALLHDLGRTAISLAIWDKPSALTKAEWERVRLYPYYTERILSRSTQLAPFGALAGLHRERLDSSGYHRGLPEMMQPPLARLLAAADTYQSKIEARAYRPALSPESAAHELVQQVRAGKLDAQAVDAVLGNRATSPRANRPSNLSEREIEVLQLIAQGYTTRNIAESLFISPKTADHHIQHIYNKIGVSTRAAATLFAMQHDLLSTAK
ncbi:MAG: LuxR C-terminal-related transcriptional regulator [Anaerolineae bacterium]